MNYAEFVNIKQGSASVHRFSSGNTLPLIQRPFAMTAFAPQTESKSSWFYHPSARSFEGVRITHQPSPWIADYGTVIFLPQKNGCHFSPDARWSGFRPQDVVLTPSYMKYRLLRYRCTLEATPGVRGGALRVLFDDGNENYFSVMPLYGESSFRFDHEKNALYGTVSNCRDNDAKDFKMFFIVRFGNGQIAGSGHTVGTEERFEQGDGISGDGVGIHLKATGNRIDAFIATSYISFEQAQRNYEQEFTDKDFEALKEDAQSIWESYLSRVEIKAKDEKQFRTFYSCLYRAFLYPHKCYELDEKGEPVHYQPYDGKVYAGVRYTDNGFWDTYRTCYPFYAIVAKDEYRDMCRGFVNDYKECGWLPRWPSIGERGCMPSTLIDAVLCDAAVKGLMDRETMETALEGMLKHATTDSENDDYGRSGASSYCRLGYVPIEAHRESVNLTLDAAYGDWCIARIAEILGKPAIVKEYDRRAKNYVNLFDPDTGFMRPKYEDGSFRPGFCPTAWGRDYTEGSAWQNSFAVPHDITGLASLFGGKEKLFAKADELFATPPDYESVGYECEIHEETEMAAVDFGQCAISNQPSFHLPYLYAALGDVEKTSYWVGRICEELFSDQDDGFPGDEDNGSMALWFVFSSIGIYPFCPGKNEYIRTKKRVESVNILGKEFDADAFPGNTIPYSVFDDSLLR